MTDVVLRVRDGELEGQGSWVYAWVGARGVVYVGGTGLDPATRTWLHLRDPNPEVGRMLARYADLRETELDVVAVRLGDEVDRQQVRHGAVVELERRGLLAADHVCDPPGAVEPSPDTDRFVAAIEEHLS